MQTKRGNKCRPGEQAQQSAPCSSPSIGDVGTERPVPLRCQSSIATLPPHDDRRLWEQFSYGLGNTMRKKSGAHRMDTTNFSDIFVSVVG